MKVLKNKTLIQIHQRKSAEQDELQKKLESVQMAAEKEKDMLQVNRK